jgi:hypothetical protein
MQYSRAFTAVNVNTKVQPGNFFQNNFHCANTLRSTSVSLYQQLRNKEVHNEIQPVKQIKNPDR